MNMRSILIAAGTAAGGSAIAAFDRDTAIAWTGAAVAIGGFALSAIIAAYHQLREARRQEAVKDLAAGLAEKTHADQEDLKNLIGGVNGRIIDLHERLTAVVAQRDELLKTVLAAAAESRTFRCPYASAQTIEPEGPTDL